MLHNHRICVSVGNALLALPSPPSNSRSRKWAGALEGACPVHTPWGLVANELASITTEDGREVYLYDADGIRIRQDAMTSSDALDYANYEFFPQYERKVKDGVETNTKYYFFGGQRIAQKVGTGALTYLHADHLGSVLATTGVANSKRFYPYGATRTGSIPTDFGYTGQHNDGTGLLYYKARYYDPASGQFLSPDTIVPDPSNLFAYNRYMYGYGNPVKYSDPSGHTAECAANDHACWVDQFNTNNAWYNARGYFWDGGHWSIPGNPFFASDDVARGVLSDAGLSLSAESGLSWSSDWIRGLASGVSRLGSKLVSTSAGKGLLSLSGLLGGGALMHLQPLSTPGCNADAPCVFGFHGRGVYWPVTWFATSYASAQDVIGATAVHELAHIMDGASGLRFSSAYVNDTRGNALTQYANCQYPDCLPKLESFAEGIATFVYGQNYANNISPWGPVNPNAQSQLFVDQAALVGSLLGAK